MSAITAFLGRKAVKVAGIAGGLILIAFLVVLLRSAHDKADRLSERLSDAQAQTELVTRARILDQLVLTDNRAAKAAAQKEADNVEQALKEANEQNEAWANQPVPSDLLDILWGGGEAPVAEASSTE